MGSIVQQKLKKEKDKQIIEGPFTSDPLQNMVYSHLGLVPKQEPGECRLVGLTNFYRPLIFGCFIGVLLITWT